MPKLTSLGNFFFCVLLKSTEYNFKLMTIYIEE